MIDFDDWPGRVLTKHAGLLLCVPDLVALDLPAIIAAAGYPGTTVIPATCSILSLLALKLANVRRVCHVKDRYARRMTIEQRLAEAIRSFHLDSLSSAVPLNVELDVVLSVLASAVCSALRRRLPGYQTATPDTLQRRFLQTGGVIQTNGDTITVRLDRRAHSPVLRGADLPDTTVPWWNGRRLHLQYAEK